MISLIVFSAAIGWCGTPYPMPWDRRKFPRKFPPPPPPQNTEWHTWYTSVIEEVAGNPEPQPWRIAFGVAGGILGGIAASSFLDHEQFIVIGMAAFSGGRIAADIGSMFMKN